MKLYQYLTTAALLSTAAFAQEAAEAAPAEKSEKEQLAEANALAAERLKAELAEQRAEVARLKAEREAIAERLALLSVKEDEKTSAANKALKAEADRATLEATLAKAKADLLVQTNRLEATRRAEELAELKHRAALETAKDQRESFADSEPVYLDTPLKDDVLTISDRRIPLNGPITYRTADFITERLSFYNAKDGDKPIFIVIDSSPGGSVMSGYRILKAMEASSAPVHVVVKSFAASMAACITTLAEESYAYPNAVLLHHQISATVFGSYNLTQQKEFYEESNEWWERLAKPVADKMGVTLDEFIEQMYANTTSGDWSEFGTEAQKLKWVNNIVESIVETSIDRHPDSAKSGAKTASVGVSLLTETVDDQGRPTMYLPRLTPFDRYFLFNPDQYYKLR